MMNSAKLTLIACPIGLTSMLMGTGFAHASEPTSFLQVSQVNVAQTVADRPILAPTNLRSDPPIILTGCGCTQCIKAEQLLQSRLPGF